MKPSHPGSIAIAVLGGLALIFIVALILRYRSDIQSARAGIARLDSQVAETRCGPIEYSLAGSGDPVLVIHGNAGGFDQGLGLAADYLAPGFQVIAPSRFGYLRSPLPAGASPALQADYYACLLDVLGIQKVAVLTSSAGVTSSIQFALRYPGRVSALVLQSPNAPGRVDMQLPPKAAFTALMHSDFAWWALATFFRPQLQSLVGVPQGFALTPAYQTYVRAVLASVLPISRRAEGMIFDTYVSNPSINQDPIEQVQAPTLVISAVDDPMALHENARELARRIPNARLAAIPDGGHLLLGHIGEARAEVTRFLSAAALAQKDVR